MRAFLLVAAAAAVLSSGPVAAGPHGVYVRPYMGFGFGYGYPFYGPYYSPWFYGPSVGVGIQLGGNQGSTKRERTERGEQQAFKLFVYPAAGQSEAQTAEDRYQCHVWGAGQSGHDPTLGAGTREEAEGYTRAFTACMEGRGYVVK